MDRAEMSQLLRRISTALYQGAPVPPMEGGRLFHDISEERRRRNDLFWTERRLTDLARELGLWPWTVAQILSAARRPAEGAGARPSAGLRCSPDAKAGSR
jgi:hypothetical protein